MAAVPKPPDTSSAAYAAGREFHGNGATLSEGMEQAFNLNVVTDASDERDFTAGWEAAEKEKTATTEPLSLDAQIAAKMRSHADTAAAEHTAQELEGAVEAARLWMRDHAGHDGDAVKALHLCLTETEKATNGKGASKKIRGLLCYAFLQLQGETAGEAAELEEAERTNAIATKLLALSDIAERDCTAQELAAARQEMREWMREHGVGKPLAALALRLKDMGPATVKRRGLVVHAARAILEEGTADRATVPTQDAPTGIGSGKGKKGKKAPKPAKSKKNTSWVGKIGASAVGFRATVATTMGPVLDETILAMIAEGGHARPANTIGADPCYWWCPIDDPATGGEELTSLPTLGADPEWIVWGLRRDAKVGCPSLRFRAEAERDATREAKAAGREHAPAARIKELTDMRTQEWYRGATPTTTVFPVAWHRPTSTLWVHTENAVAVERAMLLASKALGGVERVKGLLEQAEPNDIAKLTATDLRREDLSRVGSADYLADALTWLIARTLGGTGTVTLEGGARLEWWLADDVALSRDTADEKRLKAKLSGAPAEGGSLAGALADGMTMQSARIALRVDGDQTWQTTLTGLSGGRSWKLPTTTKPDGTANGLDACIDERLRSWVRGRELLDVLLGLYIEDRFDAGSWRQRMSALRNQTLGAAMVKAWGFNEATGQGLLFADMLPGRQGTLASVTVEDKRPGAPRGRKARDEANAAREA